jgi:hypothetical protein
VTDLSDLLAGGRPKRSTYRMTLPFRVDPSVNKRIRFLGTEAGQRYYYATVELAARSGIGIRLSHALYPRQSGFVTFRSESILSDLKENFKEKSIV